MMNLIWVALLSTGIITALAGGRADAVTETAMKSAEEAVSMVLGLLGIMVLWLSLSRMAEEAGVVGALARLVQPLLSRLFPGVPRGHPALGSIALNVSANMLGLGSAATPFGLRAMQQLQELNPRKDTASDAMITFLVLNTSGVTLLPTVVVGIRAQYGSANPAEIMGTTLAATLCSTAVGLLLDYALRRRDRTPPRRPAGPGCPGQGEAREPAPRPPAARRGAREG